MSPSSFRPPWRRFRLLALVAGILGIGVLGSGALAAERLLDARREMRAAKLDLNAAWLAMQGYDKDEARAALRRAEQHLDVAIRKGRRFPLSAFQALPLAGSPVRALHDGHRAAFETVAAGWLLIDAAEAFPTPGAGDNNNLTVAHGAAVDSGAGISRAEDRLGSAKDALEGPAGAFLPPIAQRAKRMMARVEDAANQLAEVRRGLGVMAALTEPGVDARLLLVAQDTTELRPTGGDLGSFGVLHFRGDKVELEGYSASDAMPLPDPPMEPPAELAPALSRPWELSGANWWPDFPTSAANIAEMFRRQGGGQVDGVVAVTDDFIAKLIGVLGPIKVPGYAKPVTEKGFSARVIHEVELKRPLDNPQKKFVIELSREVFSRIRHLPPDLLPRTLDAVNRSLLAGDIQVWFARPGWQSAIAGTAWSGALPAPDGDFLMLAEANMVNSRANADLVRSARYRVQRRGDGRLVAHLQVVYRNQGPLSEINPHYNGFIRLYVPRGSALLGGEAARDAEDGSYGVFTQSVLVPPKGEQVVTFDYLLPDSVVRDGTYRLTWMRQVGTAADSLVVAAGDKSFKADPAERAFVVEVEDF